MKRASLRRVLWVGAIAILAALLVFLRGIPEKNRVPLSEAVYIWQRSWTPQVIEAVQELPDGIAGVLPLVAEVGFELGIEEARVTRIRWKPESLSSSGLPVTLVIRIGDSGAQTEWEPWATEAIVSLGISEVRKARETGVLVGGLQIDYDCPASRLRDYRKLMEALKAEERLASLELSFTSLPSWLNSDLDGFRELAVVSDYFVLQVHALELPKTAEDPVVVMNAALARSAVRKARLIESPYFVALPTYSSFVVFDESVGKVVDVISEDLDFSRVSEDQRLLLGEAPAKEIASLISDWREKRPDPQFQGLFWYRLPVEGDVLNWPLSTWLKVRAGEAPQRNLQVAFQTQEEGFERLALRNDGQLPDARFPKTVTIRLEGSGRLVGADGSRWYFTEGVVEDRVVYRLSSQKHDPVPLPVGREMPMGWIRKTGPGELVFEFSEG